MEFLGEITRRQVVLRMMSLPSIPVRLRPKMQSRSKLVAANGARGHVITTSFDQVNLSRGRPATINLVLWEEPDRGPNPLTGWHLRFHLDAAILHVERIFGRQLGRHHRVQIDASIACVLLATVVEAVSALVSEVEAARLHSLLTKPVSGLDGLQVQLAILNE